MSFAAPRPPALTRGAVAALIGVLGGLIGLGGAEFRLPYLVGVLGLTVRQAVPVNLAISLATVLAAFPARLAVVAPEDLAAFAPEAAALAVGAVVAAFVGAGWLKRMSDRNLSRVILALLVVLGAALIVEGLFGMAGSGLVPEGAVWRIAAGVLFGLVIGFVSSLLGVAGGEVIIPTLVLGFGAAIKVAGSLSLLISLPTIAVGLARYIRQGLLRQKAVLRGVVAPMAAGSVVGAVLGGLLVGFVSAELLKLALGVVLIWSAWKTLRHHAAASTATGTATG